MSMLRRRSIVLDVTLQDLVERLGINIPLDTYTVVDVTYDSNREVLSLKLNGDRFPSICEAGEIPRMWLHDLDDKYGD